MFLFLSKKISVKFEQLYLKIYDFWICLIEIKTAKIYSLKCQERLYCFLAKYYSKLQWLFLEGFLKHWFFWICLPQMTVTFNFKKDLSFFFLKYYFQGFPEISSKLFENFMRDLNLILNNCSMFQETGSSEMLTCFFFLGVCFQFQKRFPVTFSK